MVAADRTSLSGVSGLLAAVRASGVLTDAQFERAAASLSRDAQSAPDAATELVAAEFLTRFQADRLLAGKTGGMVFGQYIILEPVGASPNGRVFKARHRTMNRIVAVKMLSAEQSRDPERRAWFHSESRAAARLAHPNVVTLLDANQVGDRLYVVREFVDGPSLDTVVRDRGPLTIARACEVVRQAALGLHHAHEKGLTHGAMCPAQLLVGHDQPGDSSSFPSVKVSNFGLRLEAVQGSAPPDGRDPADFREPERSGDGSATPESDVYALGGTFFFLLTGRLPTPRVDETARPDLPTTVAALLREMQSPVPSARPTAAAVAAALAPFAETSDQVEFAVSAHPIGGSQVGGFLSGIHPPRLSATPAPMRPVAPVPDDTSPWASLDVVPTVDGTSGTTPVVVPRPRPEASHGHAWLVGLAIGMAIGMTVLTVGTAVAWLASAK